MVSKHNGCLEFRDHERRATSYDYGISDLGSRNLGVSDLGISDLGMPESSFFTGYAWYQNTENAPVRQKSGDPPCPRFMKARLNPCASAREPQCPSGEARVLAAAMAGNKI